MSDNSDETELYDLIIDKYIWNGEWVIDESGGYIDTGVIRIMFSQDIGIYPYGYDHTGGTLNLLRCGHFNMNKFVLKGYNTPLIITDASAAIEDVARAAYLANMSVMVNKAVSEYPDKFQGNRIEISTRDQSYFSARLHHKVDTEFKKWIKSGVSTGDIFGKHQKINLQVLYKFNIGDSTGYLMGIIGESSVDIKFIASEDGEYMHNESDITMMSIITWQYKRSLAMFK